MGGKAGLAAAGLVLTLAACGAEPSGEHWKRVGSIENGYISFVEVEPAFAKDGAVYRDAVQKLCSSTACWQVGFFVAGDRAPPSGQRRNFFGAGGWSGYAPAAVYNRPSGEFTKWDCEKAGEADAPESALCGAGVREQYAAVLALATRDGWTKGCGLPATDSREVFERFAVGQDEVRRSQLRGDYDRAYRSASDGPDDPADCQALRPRIELDGENARKLLAEATGK